MMSDTERAVGLADCEASARQYATIGGYTRAAIRRIYRGWETDPNRSGIADARVREALARLRTAGSRPPGASPEVWEYLPGDPALYIQQEFGAQSRPGEPTAQEIAVHHALTLWAAHQQSKNEPMHDDRQTEDGSQGSISFAQAIRLLSQRRDGEREAGDAGPVRRRFVTALRAQSVAAMVRHSRGLVQMLRVEGIAFDYGRFSEDLLWFQFTRTRSRVQRQWSRDFHRFPGTEPRSLTPSNTEDNEA